MERIQGRVRSRGPRFESLARKHLDPVVKMRDERRLRMDSAISDKDPLAKAPGDRAELPAGWIGRNTMTAG